MVSTYVRDALEMGGQDSGSAPSFGYLPTHRSESQVNPAGLAVPNGGP